MPVIRKFAVQGHYVPRAATPARGPFPSELYTTTPRAEEKFPKGDSLHEALDDVRYFKCKECGDIMSENDMEMHMCSDELWELRRTTRYMPDEKSYSRMMSGESSSLGLAVGEEDGARFRDYVAAEYALDDVRGYDGYDRFL